MKEDITLAKRYLTKAKNAIDKGKEFSLSLKHFTRMMNRKHCQYTGLRFSDDVNSPLYRTLERIDASIGYTDTNTIVVCHSINLLKSVIDDSNNPVTTTHVAKMLKKLATV